MPANSLQIASIVSMPFAENTYIAYFCEDGPCIVIDPGLEPQKILDYLASKGLTPAAILNTHGHADHIGGNAALKRRWPEAPLVIGRRDAEKLVDAEKNLSAGFGLPVTSPPADRLLAAGEVFSAAGIDLEVRETPGHSSGHVVFVYRAASPMIVFGGDVLFQGGVGRTDFPDGSFAELERSIRTQLYTLPDDTLVLPGHGEPTTVGEERRTNPFVGDDAGPTVGSRRGL